MESESQSGGFSFSECSSLLERQKRILSELKDQANILPKKVKTEDSCQAEEHLGQHDIKIECQQAMDEFKKLKLAFIQLKSRTKLLDYLENVPRDEWPSVISCDEESKKTRHQLKDAKTEAGELQEHLQIIMKQVQNCQETLDNKLESLEKTIEDTNDVAAEIEQEIEVRSSEALASLKGSGINLENFQEVFDKQKEELKSAESFLSHYEPVRKRIQEGTESLRKEQQMLLAKTQKAMKNLSQQIEDKSHKGKQESEKRKWCESASKMLTELSGVSEKSIEDNCWTLELSTAGCIPGLKDGMTALLSLHFKPGTETTWTTKQLISATIDTDTLEISDLVQEAVRRNNVTFLVSAVMRRFRTHAPLFLEVEQLRHQYAIDWVPEDGILRVIFGDSAQIVCTLSLATGPQGTTMVHLKSIEGVGQHPPIEEFKPSHQSPRISDWLDYLQEAVKDL